MREIDPRTPAGFPACRLIRLVFAAQFVPAVFVAFSRRDVLPRIAGRTAVSGGEKPRRLGDSERRLVWLEARNSCSYRPAPADPSRVPAHGASRIVREAGESASRVGRCSLSTVGWDAHQNGSSVSGPQSPSAAVVRAHLAATFLAALLPPPKAVIVRRLALRFAVAFIASAASCIMPSG